MFLTITISISITWKKYNQKSGEKHQRKSRKKVITFIWCTWHVCVYVCRNLKTYHIQYKFYLRCRQIETYTWNSVRNEKKVKAIVLHVNDSLCCWAFSLAQYTVQAEHTLHRYAYLGANALVHARNKDIKQRAVKIVHAKYILWWTRSKFASRNFSLSFIAFPPKMSLSTKLRAN